MDISVKELLTGVENLGLDTQAVRDFQVAASSGQIQEDPYKHILVTLKAQIEKVFIGAAEPAAVQLLLSRLDKKLQADLAGLVRVTESKQVIMTEDELHRLLQSRSPVYHQPSPPDQSGVNEEILHQLRIMNEEVKGIKDNQFHTISPVTPSSSSSTSTGLESVFVNPIDESKVKELKTSITIESKNSKKNLTDKIKRLKELKREKEE